jgi:PAS domain S-box-containing protein
MTSKLIFGKLRPDFVPTARAPMWFRAGSILLIAFAASLVVLALGRRVYTSNLEVAALIAVLLAQVCAGILYACGWLEDRKGIDATEREFTSIFLHVLDGILILDDSGVCLDANPAAFAILGAPPAVLVGHCFDQFFKDPQQFQRQWRMFLRNSNHRWRTELVRADGSRVFAQCTLSANYLPGRHVMILCNVTECVEAQQSARESHNLYQQMADNIAEVFWLLDASTKKVVTVNRAYETLTGRPLESIQRNPSSYEELIHPADRVRVLAKLEDAVHTGHFDEEFRIVRADGAVRWVWVKGNPVPAPDDVVRQLFGTALDITARKLADAQVAEHLLTAQAARAEAESASAEAEALRKATLALTQNLRMDTVLDTLLQTLFHIVPYEMASVILTEENERLFVAREAPPASANRPVVTLEVGDNALLQRVLVMKKGLHLADTREETEWREHKALAGVRSWIAVPLVASETVLGLFSIGSKLPRAFTTEHFRLAKLLAIPAAVAIHNARLYEWAQIYAAERQSLLRKLDGSSNPPQEDTVPRRGRLPS